MLRKFDPGALMALVERHRVTRLLAVPTIFNAAAQQPRAVAASTCRASRQLIIGGSPASPELVRGARGRARGAGDRRLRPDRDVADHHPRPAAAGPDRQPSRAERRQERQAMTGWAIPGVRIRVVDARRERRPARRRADRRDRRPRQHGHGRLLPRPRGDRRRRSATAGSTPATWPRSTRRATS